MITDTITRMITDTITEMITEMITGMITEMITETDMSLKFSSLQVTCTRS